MDVDSFCLHWTAQVRISPKLSKQLTRKFRMALLVDAMQNPKKLATKKNVAICMCLAVVVLTLIIAVSVAVPKAHKKKQVVGFHKDFSITWAENHTRLLDDGQRLELLLDPESGKLQFRRAFICNIFSAFVVFCSYSKMIRCECFVSSSALTFVSSSPLWFNFFFSFLLDQNICYSCMCGSNAYNDKLRDLYTLDRNSVLCLQSSSFLQITHISRNLLQRFVYWRKSNCNGFIHIGRFT